MSNPEEIKTHPNPIEQNPVVDENNLNQEAQCLLAPFGFVKRNKREMWEAFKANPEGVERCALLAKAKAQREGRSGAGLLLTMVRAGEHLLEAKPDTPMPTGWRWVRANHGSSGRYVEDPEGVDKLPQGYDFTPSPRYESPLESTDEVPGLTDEVRVELRKLGVRA